VGAGQGRRIIERAPRYGVETRYAAASMTADCAATAGHKNNSHKGATMRIVLLGPPGSGKSELSKRIASQHDLTVITVHSVMQTAASENSELGRLAKEAVETARVSDELLLALLRIQLPRLDVQRGFLLVDLPKNAGQADVLDSILNDLGAPIQRVINLRVDPDELMERLVGRITCDSCGAQYNTYVNPPLVEGVCDVCGARVIRRPDDYEETISNRLRVYEAQMGPLLQHYRLGDRLSEVAADQAPDMTWSAINRVIDMIPDDPCPEPLPALAAAPAAATDAAVGSRKPEAGGNLSASAGKSGSRKSGSKKAATAQSTPSDAPADEGKSKKGAHGKAASRPAAPNKVAAKEAAPKNVASKKTTPKKTTPKKVAPKKTTPKKTTPKKVAPKKTTPKKTAPKKTAPKKTAPKKTAPKKAAPKKTAPKKAAPKKAAPKKTAPKKTAPKKAAPKKAAPKKAAPKKAAPKKAAPKKAAAKKATSNKAAPKKAAPRKASTGRGSSTRKA
jgi:adenylate kinase